MRVTTKPEQLIAIGKAASALRSVADNWDDRSQASKQELRKIAGILTEIQNDNLNRGHRMSQHTYEFELELGTRNLFCTVVVEYDYQPGEPMVLYHRDGSGYPGSPAEVEPFNIEVTTVELGDDVLDRDELMKIGDRSWGQYLDKLAYEHVRWACDKHDQLWEDLLSNAEGEGDDRW